jgi:hypothetical protein
MAAASLPFMMIDCRWADKEAPFLVIVNNTLSKDGKIRQCPKKWDSGCTGMSGQPNSYFDCRGTFPPGESYALINVGVGYIVVEGNRSITMQPLVPGGGSWVDQINIDF